MTSYRLVEIERYLHTLHAARAATCVAPFLTGETPALLGMQSFRETKFVLCKLCDGRAGAVQMAIAIGVVDAGAGRPKLILTQ